MHLVWKFFIAHYDDIIYLSKNTKDCAVFLSYDTKVSRLLKVSCVYPEIYGVCLKISRLVQISRVCLEISSMCPETLIVQKIMFISYHMTQQIARLLKVSGLCPEVLSMY